MVKKAVETALAQEGYTWCPDCQANFQGEVCPGCSVGVSPGISPETEALLAAQEEETPPSIKTKETKETLKCILSEAEILEISRRGSRANAEILQIEEELQAVKSQFKSRIDTAIACRNDCAQRVNNGYEFRPVDCEVVLNYDQATVTVIRKDTLETVTRRTMTRDETQRQLFP